MSSLTTKYGIAYPQLADTIASLAGTVQTLAGRVDLLLGESGVWTPTFVAGTAATTPITLARTYPGNVGGSPPGMVIFMPATATGAGVTLQHWVTTWTGTATTITGFTLAAICSNAGARTLYWRFLPVL